MNFKKHITDKIEQLKTEMEAYSCTMEESLIASEYVKEAMKDISKMQEIFGGDDDKKTELNEAFETARKSDIFDHIIKLTDTLNLDLAEVKTRYLITSGDPGLISPAGFSPHEQIFIKNDIWIECDILPGTLEKGLVYYDMTKMVG